MSHPDKQQLMQEFSDFLEQTSISGKDLPTLLTAMTLAKIEANSYTQKICGGIQQYADTLETLKADNQALVNELDRVHRQLHEQHRSLRMEMERRFIFELLDLYDRMASGALLLKRYTPVNRLFSHSKKQDKRFIKSIDEGHNMSLKRLETLLQSYQVYSIQTVGKIFAPETMTVVATVYKNQLPQGYVVEELRKGFYLGKKVLRVAEVKVNKKLNM